MLKFINHLANAKRFLKERGNYTKFKQIYFQNKGLISRQLTHAKNTRRLVAVYDFLDLPYTSDIANFIANAETERRVRKLHKLDIVLVSNDKFPANPAYEKRINQSNYRHLIYNMAIEYTRLFPHIGSVLLLEDRQQAIDVIQAMARGQVLFPLDYNPKIPGERATLFDRPLTYHTRNYAEFALKDSNFNALCAPQKLSELARKWIKRHVFPKVPITICLREDSHIQPQRANNISQWQKLIDHYKDDERFVFVVLRDFYNVYEEEILVGDNVVYCNEAVISISFRAALVQEASINLCIPHGLNILTHISNKTRYIQFKTVDEEVNVTSEKFIHKVIGFSRGDSWPGATQFQRIIWEDDDFEVMHRELDKMVNELEVADKLTPDFYHDSQSTVMEKTEESAQKESNTLAELEQTSLSSRTPLPSYIIMFKLLQSLLMIRFYWRNWLTGFEFTPLERITLKPQHKLLLYGAGSVTRKYLSDIKNNTLAVIDRNCQGDEEEFCGVPCFPVEALSSLEFDFIVVTPQGREIEIIHDLAKNWQIPKAKFLVISSDVYKP